MKHIASVILGVALLAGCATKVPDEVLVPVATKCDATMPPVPAWATKTLTPESGIYDQVKALLAERQQALGYLDELRSALAECSEDEREAAADAAEEAADRAADAAEELADLAAFRD